MIVNFVIKRRYIIFLVEEKGEVKVAYAMDIMDEKDLRENIKYALKRVMAMYGFPKIVVLKNIRLENIIEEAISEFNSEVLEAKNKIIEMRNIKREETGQ